MLTNGASERSAKTDRPSRVLVAVPTLDWTLNTQLASFLLELSTGAIVSLTEWRFEVVFLPDTAPVHYARNVLVGEFLRGSCDYLWFIDNDVMPTRSAVRVLDVADADIVTGWCPIVRPDEEGHPILVHAAFESFDRAKDAFRYAKPNSGPAPIAAAGAGCLLVRRRVLADPRLRLDPHYESFAGKACTLDDEADAAPGVFRVPSKPNGEPLIGEDMDFVWRAHCLGYRCVLEPLATAGHMKRVDLAGVEGMIRRAIRSGRAKEPENEPTQGCG